MTIRIVLAFSLLLVAGANLEAQTATGLPNHWATLEECLAPSADAAPYYIPERFQTRAFDEKTEIRLGLPGESCVDLDLPDRLANPDGYAWIKTRAGESHVYERLPGNVSGRILRRSDCNNIARRIVPRPSRREATNAVVPAIPAKVEVGVDVRASGSVEVVHRFPEPLKVDVSGVVLTQASPVSPPTSTPAPNKPNWFSFKRNGKWFWPLTGVGVGVGAYCGTGHCSPGDKNITIIIR